MIYMKFKKNDIIILVILGVIVEILNIGYRIYKYNEVSWTSCIILGCAYILYVLWFYKIRRGRKNKKY